MMMEGVEEVEGLRVMVEGGEHGLTGMVGAEMGMGEGGETAGGKGVGAAEATRCAQERKP